MQVFTQAVADQIIIQENQLGFCSVDGSIMTSVDGYTGEGYADTDRGVGKSISWSVSTPTAGTYHLRWRYGNGGGSGDRPARLLINSVVQIDTVNFPHTGTWTNWTISDSVAVQFSVGINEIRIEAYSVDGLGNYDYLIVLGEGMSPAECIPSYILTVGQNDPAGGNVSFEPVQDYYPEGTEVTVSASPNQGYFFQSWSGDETSTDPIFTFPIRKNTELTAIFLPEGTVMDTNLTGYATVQDDRGTPYLVIGGVLGDSLHASTLEEMQNYLNSTGPLTVTFSDHFIGTQEIKITSHKTLLGLGDHAHLQGIGLRINGARNVIVKHVTVSHVTPQDAVEINGASKNIWIDHCEFYSDRDHGQDYYDGLLDIKNESSFITVSWCTFHDHEKTILISSGDQAVADSVIRATFHHNYFYNCSSRLPSIRFGKAHIFNNYYKNCNTAINSRMGACVRIEKNYFRGVGTAVMMEYSMEKGGVELIDNYFGTSVYATEPSCVLDIPYEYILYLNETADIPFIVAGDIVPINEKIYLPYTFSLSNYPNPFNAKTIIRFTIPKPAQLTLKIFSVNGQEIIILADKKFTPGEHTIQWNAENNATGIYLYQIRTSEYVKTKKMILLK